MKTITLLCFALLITTANAQWVPQNTGITYLLNSVYFTDVNKGYAVGLMILKTTDGGISWVECVLSGSPSGLNSVHFPNTDTGYVVGGYCYKGIVTCSGLILSTIDGGTNWVQQSPNLSYGNWYLSVHFPNTQTGYVISRTGGGFGEPDIFRVIKTTDGGSHWFMSCTFPDHSCYLQSVYFISVDTGYLTGDDIRKTTDGGTNWSIQYPYSGNVLYSIHFPSTDTGYAVGDSGTILKTNDGGTNWMAQNSCTTNTLYSVYFKDSNTGFAVGDGGTILNTTDGGNNWVTQNSNSVILLHSVHFPNIDTGYAVGDSGTILKTTNGGGPPVGSNNLTSKSNTLKLYPNPASDYITIETSEISNQSQLSILNLHGQELITCQITESKTKLDITNLLNGIYFFRATGEKKVQVGKIIKL